MFFLWYFWSECYKTCPRVPIRCLLLYPTQITSALETLFSLWALSSVPRGGLDWSSDNIGKVRYFNPAAIDAVTAAYLVDHRTCFRRESKHAASSDPRRRASEALSFLFLPPLPVPDAYAAPLSCAHRSLFLLGQWSFCSRWRPCR